MKLLNKRVKNKLKNYIFSTYERIEVQSGDINYNQRCHLNAVHYTVKNNEDEIALCITDHGNIIIH